MAALRGRGGVVPPEPKDCPQVGLIEPGARAGKVVDRQGTEDSLEPTAVFTALLVVKRSGISTRRTHVVCG